MSGGLSAAKPGLVAIDRTLFDDVKVEVEARLGSAELTIQALMALGAGSVLPLDRDIADPVDLYVNGACVARGEIVAVGDRFGIRIVEIASS
ncbi:flagellar motor switch protein FliN [Flavisphingomonas formosensis]|uniref:flagellar motor switch protein FliN n=1 Tax=Flavisphingomonas formosensis TaxID=861534 RepID=UPI0012F7749E|nr:flagellar motor switch protein FliN [Sphingomonas formosensis]